MGRDASEIREWLAGRFAQRLDKSASEIRVDVPVIRYPLDSVELTGISGDLLEWLELDLVPEDLAEQTTIAAIADYLAQYMAERDAS